MSVLGKENDEQLANIGVWIKRYAIASIIASFFTVLMWWNTRKKKR